MIFTKFALIVAVFAVGLMVVGCNGDTDKPKKEEAKDAKEILKGIEGFDFDAAIALEANEDMKFIVVDDKKVTFYKDIEAAKTANEGLEDDKKFKKVESKDKYTIFTKIKEEA